MNILDHRKLSDLDVERRLIDLRLLETIARVRTYVASTAPTSRIDNKQSRPALRSLKKACHAFRMAVAISITALAAVLAIVPLRNSYAMDRAVEPVVGQIVTSMQSLLRPSWIAYSGSRLDARLGLAFLNKGEEAPSSNCVSELRSQFEEQIASLSDRTGIRLRIVSVGSEPAVHIVIGDTYQLTAKQSGEVPLDEWWKSAERRVRGASVRSLNLGSPSSFPTIWLEGLYKEPPDGSLLYGRLLIHWSGITARTKGSRRVCEFDFVKHLAWLYSLDLISRFRKEIDDVGATARIRAGVDEHRDIDAAADIQILIVGIIFCSTAKPTIETIELTDCARRIVDLVNQLER